ncbi:hypothetical protein BDZ45DRAFT_808007 [Acephala macrosclerotiorum]|nr:hypothetical protein BDZ45DRAFT_808007 [Acephala macrosclerotiorum]
MNTHFTPTPRPLPVIEPIEVNVFTEQYLSLSTVIGGGKPDLIASDVKGGVKGLNMWMSEASAYLNGRVICNKRSQHMDKRSLRISTVGKVVWALTASQMRSLAMSRTASRVSTWDEQSGRISQESGVISSLGSQHVDERSRRIFQRSRVINNWCGRSIIRRVLPILFPSVKKMVVPLLTA